MPAKISLQFRVNDTPCAIEAWPMERLLDVLRSQLGLTGVKEGCGEGECGACAVLIDGRLVNSCLIPVLQVEGSSITTIEGLSDGGRLHPVQQAFLDHGAAQCGICTPGMILAAVNLLARIPSPTDAEIREGLAGNLCRCTGYMRIFEAVRAQRPSRDRTLTEPAQPGRDEAALCAESEKRQVHPTTS